MAWPQGRLLVAELVLVFAAYLSRSCHFPATSLQTIRWPLSRIALAVRYRAEKSRLYF